MKQDLINELINKQLQKVSLTKGHFILLVYKLREYLYTDYMQNKKYFLEYVSINDINIFMHQSLDELFTGNIAKLSFSIEDERYGKIDIFNTLKYKFDNGYRQGLIPSHQSLYSRTWEKLKILF